MILRGRQADVLELVLVLVLFASMVALSMEISSPVLDLGSLIIGRSPSTTSSSSSSFALLPDDDVRLHPVPAHQRRRRNAREGLIWGIPLQASPGTSRALIGGRIGLGTLDPRQNIPSAISNRSESEASGRVEYRYTNTRTVFVRSILYECGIRGIICAAGDDSGPGYEMNMTVFKYL